MRRLDQVRLDHQVVVEKVGRQAVVGEDAAHLCRRDDHRVRLLRGDPGFDLGLPLEIDIGPPGGQHRAAFAGEAAHQRRTDHAAVPRDVNPLVLEVVGVMRSSPRRLHLVGRRRKRKRL